jgi:hypothetical protein
MTDRMKSEVLRATIIGIGGANRILHGELGCQRQAPAV